MRRPTSAFRRTCSRWAAASLAVAVVASLGSGLVAPAADAAPRKVPATIVVSGEDADSILVAVGGKRIDVHLAGMNAPVGSCLDAATVAFVESLIPIGTEVLLTGDLNATPDAFGEIPLRVFLPGKGDVAKYVLQKGYALALLNPNFTASANESYRKWSRVAQKKGRGLWDPNKCQSGPGESGALKLRVRWDADGKDGENLGGQWVEVLNDGEGAFDLGGWQLRDASDTPGHVFTFPSGVILDHGESVRVTGGSGGSGLHWGSADPLFTNTGDGAYLVDPDTDIRAYLEFPCLHHCDDPLIGKISLVAHFDAAGKDKDNVNGEWVDVVNISGADVDLNNHFLVNGVYTYFFDGETIVAPGKKIRVYIGKGSDTGTKRYWGLTKPILGNDTDHVEFYSMDGTFIAKHKWPCPCGPVPEVTIDFVDPGGTVDGSEWVHFHNAEGSAVDIGGWQVSSGINQYVFPEGATIKADDWVQLDFEPGSDTTRVFHWGLSDPILGANTGEVTLRTPLGDVASCYGWGGSSCDPAVVGGPVTLAVNFDAEGTSTEETAHPSLYANGEWVNLRTSGGATFDLTGYRLFFDGAVYEFDGTSIPVAGKVTVFSGQGADDTLSKYWGFDAGIFPNNPTSAKTVTLFDPVGDVVARFSWPCPGCGPNDFKILDASRAKGWIKVKNRSGADASLDDWMIAESPNQSNHYYFGDGIVVPDGGVVKVVLGPGTDNPSSFRFYWNDLAAFGKNEVIRLLNPMRQSFGGGCVDWGSGSC